VFRPFPLVAQLLERSCRFFVPAFDLAQARKETDGATYAEWYVPRLDHKEAPIDMQLQKSVPCQLEVVGGVTRNPENPGEGLNGERHDRDDRSTQV
jgi:hypothetical protein